jgi:UDP-N-acetylmuramoyl-L-alanyl-D-glutamate--2,6-diaminopimelate ligase
MYETRQSFKQLLSAWKKVVDDTDHPKPPRYDGPDVLITRLTESTAEVDEGACFVARVREGSDGHPYIGKAIALGAKVILGQRPVENLPQDIMDGVLYIQVPDTAVAVAWLAAAWEGFPSHDLVMIGITGTDGKTTTANILFSVMQAAGLKVGLLSTIKAVVGETEEPLALHVTTPEAPIVQCHLRRMVDAGLTHCIVESTSHGLAQHRVAAIDFDLAVVTNITHEHLDYHGSYEQYFAAKARLFDRLSQQPWNIVSNNPIKEQIIKTAVLNIDDASFPQLAAIDVPRRLTYGLQPEAHICASGINYLARGTDFSLIINPDLMFTGGYPLNISSSLPGEFNVYNMLAAAAAALAIDIDVDSIRHGLQAIVSVSGRMEAIDLGQPFSVIIDFAHTPNALEKLIETARGMAKGRIITVFGSAGKRDIEKRRLMAEISARRADITVLTAEDPRTESLEEILDIMAEGCRRWGGIETQSFWRVRDRGRAIYQALSMARSDDIVLICGKGHEQSMCFGTTEYPWDDRQAARTALRAVLSHQPVPDLGLPTF